MLRCCFIEMLTVQCSKMGSQRPLNGVMWIVVTLKQLIHISDKWTSEHGVQNCKESVALLVYTTDRMTYLKANV